jgi:hypothetical protein
VRDARVLCRGCRHIRCALRVRSGRLQHQGPLLPPAEAENLRTARGSAK